MPATLGRPANRRCARCGFVFNSVVTHTPDWSRAPIRLHAAVAVMRLSARAAHRARRRSTRLPGASVLESVRIWRRCWALSQRAVAPPTSATDGDGSRAISFASPAKRPCSSAFAATSGGSRSAIVKVANAPSATTTIAATITISISFLPSVRAYARYASPEDVEAFHRAARPSEHAVGIQSAPNEDAPFLDNDDEHRRRSYRLCRTRIAPSKTGFGSGQ